MYVYCRENGGYLHSVGVPIIPATFLSDLLILVELLSILHVLKLFNMGRSSNYGRNSNCFSISLMPKFPCTGNDAPKTNTETTSGYEPCSVADTKTVRSLVPDILFKKIIGLRPKLGNTYYHIILCDLDIQ